MWKSVESFPETEPAADAAPGAVEAPPDHGLAVVREAQLDTTGDARLVERVRDGDDQAFAALVVRYERKLVRVLTRLV